MNFVFELRRRLPWLNVSAGMLVVLLQRTPAVRALAHATDYVLASRAGELLRAAFTAATLGAVNSLAGATYTLIQSPANPVRGTVGSPLAVSFTYVGTPSDPQHFIVSGSPPPGMRFEPAPIGGIVRSGTPSITGTPTQAGTYTVFVTGVGLAGQGTPEPIQFEITGGAAVAPAITTQPQSVTVAAGARAAFSVVATGTPAPTFQWTRNGANIAGATAATFELPAAQPADAGAYAVVVSNSGGSVTSASVTLTVTTGGGPLPAITAQPISFTAAPGSTAALTVVTSGAGNSYQWRRGGAAIAGATNATLLLPAVGGAHAGDYTVAVTNGAGTVVSSAATLGVAAGESRLANLSVRANLAATQRLIAGFATNGTKSVLLRGIGPTLGTFGVPAAYGDPRLELYNSAPSMIGQNEDWNAALSGAFTSVGAFPLDPSSKDAALQISLAGSHSAHVTGPGSGVVLVELYDSGAGNAVRLVNVSARNFVGTDDNILIAGFVIDGTVAKTLLIRAVGPTLADFGVDGTLADPKLEIYNSATTKIVENDNWSAALAPVFGSVGAFGLSANSGDAALLVTLMPGAYSAQVSGINRGTGEALVEVYEVP